MAPTEPKANRRPAADELQMPLNSSADCLRETGRESAKPATDRTTRAEAFASTKTRSKKIDRCCDTPTTTTMTTRVGVKTTMPIRATRLAAALIVAACLLLGPQLGADCASNQRLRSTRQTGDAASVSPSDAETTTTSTTPAAAAEAPATVSSSDVASPSSSTTGGADSGNEFGERPKSKIPAVDFRLVDEQFEAASANESLVVAKWRHMDKQMVDGVRAILKVIFPHVVAMSTDAKVSGNCSGAILKWILNLRNMRSWAVKMLDATGKPSAGILSGSLSFLGNYRQCLQVSAPDEDEIELVDEYREYFRGQYCVLQMKPPLPAKPSFYSLNSTIASLLRNTNTYKYYEKTAYDELSELALAFNFVNLRADLCVPSLCSRDDIQRVADFIGAKLDMRARVLRCDTMANQTDSRLDRSQLAWLIVLGLALASVLVSTMIALAFGPPNNPHHRKSRLYSLLSSMSISRSYGHMRDVQLERVQSQKPLFLYSLRLIVLLWVFLVALVGQLNFQFLREMLTMRQTIMLWPMQLIVNSSLAYDALILLTAFTYSYQNISSNMRDLIKYNVSKYSRLAPSVMLLVALTCLTPLLYANKSPVWRDFTDKPAEVCKQNGIFNLLFVQNLLFNYDQMCLPQSWLLCVELQLCLLAIPIVYLLNRNFDQNHGRFKLMSVPVLSLISLAFFGCAWNFRNVHSNQLPAAWFLTYPDQDHKNLYFSQHLAQTGAHLTTFAVGLLAGHLFRCQAISCFSGRPYGRKCCTNLMSLASLVTMVALVFGTHKWSLSGVSHLEQPFASALYAALAPLAWSLAWALLLFRLTVPEFSSTTEKTELADPPCWLSSGGANLVRLGRLSFLAYLLNPYVNQFFLAVQEQTVFSSILMLGHQYIGNLVYTFALAAIVSLLVELPFRRLTKKLALGSRRQCTNFGIIARQLNIHEKQAQQRGSPSNQAARNSFTPSEPASPAAQPMRHMNHSNQSQPQDY